MPVHCRVLLFQPFYRKARWPPGHYLYQGANLSYRPTATPPFSDLSAQHDTGLFAPFAAGHRISDSLQFARYIAVPPSCLSAVFICSVHIKSNATVDKHLLNSVCTPAKFHASSDISSNRHITMNQERKTGKQEKNYNKSTIK